MLIPTSGSAPPVLHKPEVNKKSEAIAPAMLTPIADYPPLILYKPEVIRKSVRIYRLHAVLIPMLGSAPPVLYKLKVIRKSEDIASMLCSFLRQAPLPGFV